MELSFAELAGNVNKVNTDLDKYRNVNSDDIQRNAQNMFRKENCSTLYYKAK